MYKKIALFTIVFSIAYSISSYAQTTFLSKKYPYVFTYMSGWKAKEQIYLPETDAKIVDGKGNSFIVSVKPLLSELKGRSASSIFKNASNEAIAMGLSPAGFDNVIITNRGTTYVGNKEFYYVFANEPFMDGLRLNHKVFYTNYKNFAYTIDCASISSMTIEVSPFLDTMLQTIRFY